MHLRRTVSIGMLLAGTTVSTVIAQSVPSLVITENSSTSLTATLDGVSQTVTNTSPDHWFIDLAGVIGQQYWTEPETQRVVNEVQGQPLANRIFVNSELFLGFNGLTNGVMDTTSFTLNSNRVDVTFIDRGDVAHGVPDTATTLPLLSVSLGALAIFARRKQGKDGLRIL